ncbi:GerAB/ArcD/ProY family transporter [Bacillus sp. 31A1R]|uniref:GerAB/ArcD/ProY family transporter n=1 Tax=Robertmurraya mangrovi TaxID=3098077 RepID=A0ABU5J126_9BACI|nr:GerAB/ArcD/ProY family transporter [Bacillus sp. 31A1R]MDZ5473120.1 GerAB/ArcD/ProY family transporter [Bacillus sp. 31A1R]
MKVNLYPKKAYLFNTFLVAFIIHAAQAGVGIAGLPRIVFLTAKHDAWISVFFAGVLTAGVIYIILFMLNQYESADLYGIHYDIFGKYIGALLSLIYVLYLLSACFIIVMNYVEIVQAWVFPDLQTWVLSLILLLLGVYGVLGGIRVVVGICFMSVILTIWLAFMLSAPLGHLDVTHLLPIWETKTLDIIKGISKTALSIIGFELLLFVFPYIENKKRANFYAQMGNAYTTLLFTVVTLVSIGFFSEVSLTRTIWPVLSMFKIIQFPNLERFEFIAISFWMLIVLPNICIYLWAATKGIKRVFGKNQRRYIFIAASIIWGLCFFIRARYQMNMVTDWVGRISYGTAFIYPVLLAAIVLVKKKLFKGGKKNETSS